ncbi:hypothetical protein GCM10028791_07600 [Echinicola sediminis]
MKSLLFLLTVILSPVMVTQAQELEEIELEDLVFGGQYKLENHKSAEAVVLIITTNACPFAKLYEDRILALQKAFHAKGVLFAFINPLVGKTEEESLVNIKKKIAQKNIAFSYLIDPDQQLTGMLGATKSPEAFVLTPSPTGFAVVYHGAIDNNPQLPQSVTKRYLESAINQVLQGQNPVPNYQRPVGCTIQTAY